MGVNLDAPFYPALAAYAKGLGIDPEWFLRVFYLESALNPASTNGRFRGLNALDKDEIARRGVDPDAYLGWTASAQLTKIAGPWYADTIRGYLGRVPRTIGGLYALNLAPGIVKQKGDASDVVLYASPDNRYVQNKGLDVDGDGRITIADLDRFFVNKAKEQPYAAPRAELAKYGGGAGAGGVPWLELTVAALLGGGIAWWKGRKHARR